MTLSKLQRIFTCGRKKDSGSKPESKPQTDTGDDDRDEYGALSEVAAPSPVEPTTEEQEARRASLDRNLSETHSHPHLSNN